MTGEDLKKILRDDGIVLQDLAIKLKISKQTLNSRLNAKNVTLTFLQDVSKAINKNLYQSTSTQTSQNTHSNTDKMADLMTSMFDEIRESNVFLRNVVNRGISEGAIVFDKRKPIHV